MLLCIITACNSKPTAAVVADSLPQIFPDYVGVTIPADIAPLNFSVQHADAVYVTVSGSKGGTITASGDYADFDIDDWHALTAQNRGGELTVTVFSKSDGQWTQHRDFPIYINKVGLDEWGLTYRRIAPGYEVYSHMGLYQRCLSTFCEEPVIDNRQVPGMCVNCHTANRTSPDAFVFHVRGDHGATVVQRNGHRELLQARNDLLGGSMVYPYWHPSGRYVAFSTNQTRQGFHVGRPDTLAYKRIEVFDLSSDIFVYDVETHQTIRDSLVMTADWSENVPTFSPDGRWLYFITCRQKSYPMEYRDEQYNLCRVAFDAERGRLGNKVDTLFDAVGQGKSVTWPRPSYDGRYLLFTLQDYGYFSIWHDESEQWLLDLTTGSARPADEINSPRADSYHNWSTNSRWVVFTTRRDDGLYSRLYLAAINENGRFSKPFLLPQRNPQQYYGRTLYSFNTPDFTSQRVDFDSRAAAREISSDKRTATK